MLFGYINDNIFDVQVTLIMCLATCITSGNKLELYLLGSMTYNSFDFTSGS